MLYLISDAGIHILKGKNILQTYDICNLYNEFTYVQIVNII